MLVSDNEYKDYRLNNICMMMSHNHQVKAKGVDDTIHVSTL